ncbi:MAG TPA: flagellar biosynthesis protein FlhF [Tepidisphaeraceae bacterium]|nr:flagellar biosynthesis protein FlhF [Tepidisphaeraceae bacterium]
MAECLSEVKRVMGTDAVILHTRTYVIRQWLGFKRREMVEITAGRGLNNGARQTRRISAGAARYGDQPQASAPVMRQAQPALVGPPQDAIANGQAILQSPAGNNALVMGISNDVTKLTAMVTDLVTRVRQQQAPEIPEELYEEYMQLVESQVDRDLAVEIVKNLHRTMRPDHLAQKQFVREKIADQLEKLLPVSGPIVRTKVTGPHVVALIGPTGVGKTTTIAKLAAKLKLDEKRKVGLITMDTYRIAAIDQLKKYADIIGAGLKVVGSPEDLREAVASMNDCDFVLIDTAGRGPKDTLKLNELKTFLDAAQPDEVHLVLMATLSREAAELAIERCGTVRSDELIFTKLDEARYVGAVLSLVRGVNKTLSYVTTGQDVPADIEVARGRRIAQLILGSEL